MKQLASIIVVILSLICLANSQLVSNALGTNMVLQRAPQQAALWGWTPSAGQYVTVEFDGDNYTSPVSGSDQFWIVYLPATDASSDPYTIRVISQDSSQVQILDNILFGDVFICGGQSNMQFTVSQGYNATEEIELANNYPNIRVFTVGQGNISYDPLSSFASVEQTWSVANNVSIGGADWSYFSAVCWFYVKNLYDSEEIPIGAVSSNWGGTIIQAWSSPDALAACPGASASGEELSEMPRELIYDNGDVNPNQNSVLWNAMIVPLLPMRIRGAIWYQGEANIGQEIYACMFPAMIQDWRAHWGLKAEEFSFYFVQLAPYTEDASMPGLPDTRLNQQMTTELPYTGMATTIDLGDVGSPYGNIHPQDKQTVGYRLALIARQQLYGEDDLVISGPIPKEVKLHQTAPNVLVQITFQPETLASGLYLINNTCPDGVNISQCAWYEIESSDGVWHNATEVYVDESGKSLFLGVNVNNSLLAVFGVRYGYNEWPVATLYNSDSLAAPPFYSMILTNPDPIF